MSVLGTIRTQYNTFSKAQKRFSDLLLTDMNFVLEHSITEVAEASGVAEATISRFCKQLGFKGYYDFRLSIVRDEKKEPSEKMSSGVITQEDSVAVIAEKILSHDLAALKETCEMIKSDDICAAAQRMAEAERITFYGAGSSFATALEGYNKFARITPKARINSESHAQLISASLMTERDVAIIVSHSGSSKEMIEIAKLARRQGAFVVSITHFTKSPLTSQSNIMLISSGNERFVHGYSLSMELAPIYLLDVLYVEFFKHTQAASELNKSATSMALMEKHY